MGVRSPLLQSFGDDFAWSLLDAAPDPTLVVSGSGEIVFVNDHAGTLFGRAPAELVGMVVEELLPEICTLDCGSLNFGEGSLLYVSTPDMLRDGAKRIQYLEKAGKLNRALAASMTSVTGVTTGCVSAGCSITSRTIGVSTANGVTAATKLPKCCAGLHPLSVSRRRTRRSTA